VTNTTTTPATRVRVVEVPVRTCACASVRATVTSEQEAALPKRLRSYVTDGTLATGCDRDTAGRFAPGHDARFAGLLAALRRVGAEAAYDETALTPALQAKVDYDPVVKEKPLVKVRLADGTEVEARVGRDGKARTEGGDVHPAGTWLLAS
jgi:hypothetical protein